MFEHRLLLIAETFPPSIGGMQSYLAGLWGALPPALSFVVAARHEGDLEWDRAQACRVVRASSRAWRWPRWRPAWQAARELVQREHIEALVCGKALFEGRAAFRLSREFGIPYIVCTYGTELSDWGKKKKPARDLRRVFQAAGRVVVINNRAKELVSSLGVPPHRIVKIYPGVAEEFFQPASEVDEFRRARRLQGRRIVTAVGRLIARKGYDVLLRALTIVLRSIPDAHLLIVGDGTDRARLEEIIQQEGLGRSVTLLGTVSTDDVCRAHAVAEVFALTPYDWRSDPEGFGIVYLEAAAMGKPAVASRAGGVPEAVLDGETGLLVPSGDVAATARALVNILTNTDLRGRLASRARERARQEFHWQGRALLFQGVVSALLSERDVSFAPAR